MHPFTQALIGWTVANVVPLSRRDRAIVMVASVIPDINGLRVLIDLATSHSTNPTQQLTWRGQWALNAWPNFLLTGMLLAAIFTWPGNTVTPPLKFFPPRQTLHSSPRCVRALAYRGHRQPGNRKAYL